MDIQTSRLSPSVLRALALSCLLPLAAGCHHKHKPRYVPPPPQQSSYYRTAPRTTTAHTAPTPAPAPPAATPTPATVQGRPMSTDTGMASWYGPPYHNRKGANGEIYDQNAMTAAHRTLPMGSIVRVTNIATGQSAVVKITDRGPFVHGRVIDLSLAAAKATGVYRAGVAKVKIEVFTQTPAQVSALASGGKWCVQVGAFGNEGNAAKLKNDLTRRYSSAKVIEFQGPTGHWVRVNLTQADHTHAQQIAANIHPNESGAEAYLVRLD